MTENKTNLPLYLFMIISMVFITTYTNAQEGGLILGDPVQEKPKQMAPSIEEGELDLKEQSVIRSKNTASEQKNVSAANNNTQDQNPAIKTESLNTKKPVVKEEKKQVQEDEESVLTFNFLYYIIQKFKFEEVIDQ